MELDMGTGDAAEGAFSSHADGSTPRK